VLFHTQKKAPLCFSPNATVTGHRQGKVAFAERKPLPRSTANSTVTACRCKLYDRPNSTKTQKVVCRVWHRVVCLSWLPSPSVHQTLLTGRVFSQCISRATATELSQTDPQYTTHAFQQHEYKHWCTSCHSVYFYPFHWQYCRCSSWLWPLVTRSTYVCACVIACGTNVPAPK
jgi:hypothetical protein